MSIISPSEYGIHQYEGLDKDQFAQEINFFFFCCCILLFIDQIGESYM